MGKSLEEMCRLVTGAGAWHIGNIHVSDGPHGIRAQEDGAKNNDSYEATCFQYSLFLEQRIDWKNGRRNGK